MQLVIHALACIDFDSIDFGFSAKYVAWFFKIRDAATYWSRRRYGSYPGNATIIDRTMHCSIRSYIRHILLFTLLHKKKQHCIAFLESCCEGMEESRSNSPSSARGQNATAEKRYINRSIQGFVYRRLSDSIILFPWLIDGGGLVVRFDRSPSRHRYRLRVSHPLCVRFNNK